VASTEAVAVVDVQREFAGRVALFADESHFTPEGHRLLALTVLARLREAGAVEHAGPD